ncbi:hypothetical protein RhiJN_27906 [Ceratobasidium sp. AG-Ba]|nr:hypothetical protein RhiJN_27906 [Ceratobasidium sp. AG-Ba]
MISNVNSRESRTGTKTSGSGAKQSQDLAEPKIRRPKSRDESVIDYTDDDVMDVEMKDSDREAVSVDIRGKNSAKLFRSSPPTSSPLNVAHPARASGARGHITNNGRRSSRLMIYENDIESSSRNSTPSSQISQGNQEPCLPTIILSRRRAATGGNPASGSSEPERAGRLRNDAAVARKVSGKRKRQDILAVKPERPQRTGSVRSQGSEVSSVRSMEPAPTSGLTSDGKIDYHYYVRRYLGAS